MKKTKRTTVRNKVQPSPLFSNVSKSLGKRKARKLGLL
jgi:hypothetical protein